METDQDLDNQFIIKRKRKRPIAIDPCLGFYARADAKSSFDDRRLYPKTHHVADSLSFSHRAAVEVPGAHSDGRMDPSDASLAIKSGLVIHSSPPITTVDAFLRWSAEPRRIYPRSRKRRAMVNLDAIHEGISDDDAIKTDALTDSASSRNSSGGPTSRTSSILSRSSSSGQRKDRRKCGYPRHRQLRKRRPVGTRLLQAAVLSHVDPVPALTDVNCDTGSSEWARPPLKFVTESLPPRHARSPGKDSRRKTVHPRRTRPFDNSTFRRGHSARQSSITPFSPVDCKPLSSWRPRSFANCTLDDVGVPKDKDAISKPFNPDDRGTRAPLLFVPLEEHEQALAARTNTAASASSVRRTIAKQNHGPQPLALVEQEINTHIVKSPHDPQAENDPTGGESVLPLSISHARHSCSEDPREDVASKRYYSATLNAIDKGLDMPVAVTLHTIESEKPQFSQLRSSDPTMTPTHPLTNPGATNQDPSGFETTSITSSNSRVDRTDALATNPSGTTGKPLKPLASFLDQFLETARAANQLQQSSTSHRTEQRKGLYPGSSSPQPTSRIASASGAIRDYIPVPRGSETGKRKKPSRIIRIAQPSVHKASNNKERKRNNGQASESPPFFIHNSRFHGSLNTFTDELMPSSQPISSRASSRRARSSNFDVCGEAPRIIIPSSPSSSYFFGAGSNQGILSLDASDVSSCGIDLFAGLPT